MAIEREYGKWIPTCDGCGEQLETCDTFDEALDELKVAGWSREYIDNGMDDGEWINLCPACQREEKD